MWLHPDTELDEWICSFETNAANTDVYIHSRIQPSVWRQIAAHSSVIVLNNFIFAQPLPWSVFQNERTYPDYLADFQTYPPHSAERRWLQRLNDHLKTPLEGLNHEADPVSRKLVYIYAQLFGYDREDAIELGLTPLGDSGRSAWPPKGLDDGWPDTFLYDDDGEGPLPPRPSFKRPETRAAMANAVYFIMKHFEDLGAAVHFSPWREINGYRDPSRCPDPHAANCGLDTWQDLYDTYQAIVSRIGSADFDRDRVAVYPTVQLESFIGMGHHCVDTTVIETVKRFYTLNEAAAVPFAIGLSTYPSSEPQGLGNSYSQLQHLLANLDSETPVACDENRDGMIAGDEGVEPSEPRTRVAIPRSTPLIIGEVSRPFWLSFQTQDTASVSANGELGAQVADMYLNFSYRSADGTPAYPLEFVAFSLGPNWAFPALIHGRNLWITTSSGIARHWLTPMQPLGGQLVLDSALDADGDWDNDGVLSVQDNCPYQANPLQEDADQDKLGDRCDNCKHVANFPQEDWDQDGFGNACDPDLDNDGLLQKEVDLAVIEQCQGAAINCLANLVFPDLPAGQRPPELNGKVALIADMDADEDVDENDLLAWRILASNPSLRESGYACAGKAPCPDPARVMLRDGQTVTIPDPAPDQRMCGPTRGGGTSGY
ncbi:MAG: thrombospondin type 3 repeat-containing protein [Halioglobus sp.]|nr:thrombospondin type 3 repeat-containing protein [Halioglobus sp.]